jgi:hypothetical protein
VFIGSIALFVAAILLFAGFLLPALATPQQQTTTTTPSLTSPPANEGGG